MRHSKKYLCTAIAALAMAASFTPIHAAPPSQPDSESQAVAETGYVIVELSSAAAAQYKGGKKGLPPTAVAKGRFDADSGAYKAYKRFLENEHASFKAQLNRSAPAAVVEKELFVTSNALVVRLNGANKAALKRMQGVKAVHDSTLYRLDMDQSVGLIGAPEAWALPEVGRKGAGSSIRVGIVDSGIVNSLIPGLHPFFNCKEVEIGGIFYSGETGFPAIEVKNINGNDPAPGVAYVSPHGTHVAGTVGGCVTTIENDFPIWGGTELSGVAPGATLVDYNVFPGIGAGYTAFGGSALSHDIADAIEASVVNGDHVINMSLGGGVNGPNDYLAQVSNAAVAAGVVVVTSAGNSGPGAYTVGSPGTAIDVITVGATTNSRGAGVTITVPNLVPILAVPGDFPDFDGGLEYDLIDWPGSDNLACTSDVSENTLDGKVVLIARGTCIFSQKIANAKAAGAGGVVVYSTRDAISMGATEGFDDDLPAVMVSNADGLVLEGATADGVELSKVTISPPGLVPQTPNELADFSSRGPAPFTGIVKPDVVAPGVNILSSVFSGWELFDGTSMASPHVAGAAAIVLQQNPDWAPWQVKSALTTTATKLDGLAPWEQGSGLINLPKAMAANDFFTPTNASFGIFKGKAPATGSVDIEITSDDSCVLTEPAEDGYATASLNDNILSVSFDGGRTEPAGNYGGYFFVDCGGDQHTIPWGAVIQR